MAYTTIDDPSAHFQTKIWTGNDTSQSITNDGNSNLKPDWIWAKKRSASDAHNLVDTSRGLTNYIFSNVSNGDTTDSSKVQSMDLNGFSWILMDFHRFIRIFMDFHRCPLDFHRCS